MFRIERIAIAVVTANLENGMICREFEITGHSKMNKTEKKQSVSAGHHRKSLELSFRISSLRSDKDLKSGNERSAVKKNVKESVRLGEKMDELSSAYHSSHSNIKQTIARAKTALLDLRQTTGHYVYRPSEKRSQSEYLRKRADENSTPKGSTDGLAARRRRSARPMSVERLSVGSNGGIRRTRIQKEGRAPSVLKNPWFRDVDLADVIPTKTSMKNTTVKFEEPNSVWNETHDKPGNPKGQYIDMRHINSGYLGLKRHIGDACSRHAPKSDGVKSPPRGVMPVQNCEHTTDSAPDVTESVPCSLDSIQENNCCETNSSAGQNGCSLLSGSPIEEWGIGVKKLAYYENDYEDSNDKWRGGRELCLESQEPTRAGSRNKVIETSPTEQFPVSVKDGQSPESDSREQTSSWDCEPAEKNAVNVRPFTRSRLEFLATPKGGYKPIRHSKIFIKSQVVKRIQKTPKIDLTYLEKDKWEQIETKVQNFLCTLKSDMERQRAESMRRSSKPVFKTDVIDKFIPKSKPVNRMRLFLGAVCWMPG